MIWTLISVGILIIGIIVCIVTEYSYNQIDDQEVTGAALVVFGFIATIICIFLIIFAHVHVDYNIEKNNIEYESLQKRVEIIHSEYEDISDNALIEDILNWNTWVHSCIYWSKSPWTNWFYSQREVDALKYIDIN